MTEEDRKRNYLADLLKLADGYTGNQEKAAFLRAYGVDVNPPELQWKPGQYVMLTPTSLSLGGPRHPRLARREYDGWVTFEGWLLSDDEVTDVEPVAVLTAEDARDLGEGRGIGSFERFFRERGLDL